MLEEKIVKLGLAIFDKTCHVLILEGVIIFYVMWLNPVKPVNPMTLGLVLSKYTKLTIGKNNNFILSASASVNKIDCNFLKCLLFDVML